MRRLTGLMALAALLVLAPPPSYALPLEFTALLSGPAESPPNASPGTGFADVTIDPVTHTMHVDVTFSGLTGTTTASYIHCCTAVPGTGTAGVAVPTFPGFPLGVTSGTYDHTFDMTLASSYDPTFMTASGGTPAGAEASLDAGIIADKAYLNIHTSLFPGGEIRGFLTPAAVPEPATFGLLALGITALGVGLRRRRA